MPVSRYFCCCGVPIQTILFSSLWHRDFGVWVMQSGKPKSMVSPDRERQRQFFTLKILGLYGALFRRNKEAAFSNYRLWESVGFVVAYAYSTQLCTRMKLYIQLSNLVFGFLLYCIVEIHHMRKLRRQKIKERKAAELAAQKQAALEQEPETTDDEKDDIDDEIIVTHL